MANRTYLIFLVVLVLGALAQAQTFTTLYNFSGGADGGYPYAGVVQDATGKLYGTTGWGGILNDGVVFEVNTAGTETVLYTFCSQTNCGDGYDPETPLVRDKVGNIYGTTRHGGSSDWGIVFKIDIAGKETVLYSFTGSSDGCWPYQGLVRDNAGNLYGTTYGCGSSGYGTIFKVDGAGSFTLLHSFGGGPSDGSRPIGGHLAMDKSGNLYGVTNEGGTISNGVLYKLSQNGTLTVLHSFTGTSDGCFPEGSVIQDKTGNLYGTTWGCGSNNGQGSIWKISKKGKETILHTFAGGTSDGCNPATGVARDSKGNLYGVTYGCGANGAGALYKLTPKDKFTLLHSFDIRDGASPYGEVWRTNKGKLFGTTYYGGTYGWGSVWKYVP